MAYFSKDFINFFKELAKNNNKEWFDANRKRYEKEVKKPFTAFTEEMIHRIGAIEPAVRIKPADAMFRINNDIRFSPDKPPYKTYMAANISPEGRKFMEYPGFYFQLGGDQVMIAGGAYMVEKETLYNIRSLIASQPDKFNKLINEADFKQKFGEIQGEKNKIIPKEFKEAAEKEPLVANKQFYYMTELKPDILLKENIAELMMDYYHAGRKLNAYLQEAMAVKA